MIAIHSKFLLAGELLTFSGELLLFGISELSVEGSGLLAAFADGLAVLEDGVLLVLHHEDAVGGDGTAGLGEEGAGETEHYSFYFGIVLVLELTVVFKRRLTRSNTNSILVKF